MAKLASNHAKLKFMYIMLSIFMLVGAVVLVFAVTNALRARASANWPSVAGTVVRAERAQSERRDKDTRQFVRTYWPKIVYEYAVNGIAYSSDRVAFTQHQSRDPEYADAFIRKYPKSSTVAVRYNPDDPSIATLETGLTAGNYMMFGASSLFLIVPAFMLLVVRTIVRRGGLTQPDAPVS